MRNVAVVLAGGTGTRVGLNIPKQLIKIAGKPIIEHTIAAMQASPLVDEIIVMMAPGHLDDVRAIVRSGGYDKVSQILEGAGTRNDTTADGAGRARRGRVQRAAARRRPAAGLPDHHRRQRRGAARPTRRSTPPSRRPTR